MGREKSTKRGKARRLDAANAKVIAAIKIIAFVHGHSLQSLSFREPRCNRIILIRPSRRRRETALR